MSDRDGVRKALVWLTVATALLYISILGGGLYVYYTGDKADQVEKNTERINKTVGAFCEIVISADIDEPKIIHNLAEKTLVLTSQDCSAIVRYLEENP